MDYNGMSTPTSTLNDTHRQSVGGGIWACRRHYCIPWLPHGNGKSQSPASGVFQPAGTGTRTDDSYPWRTGRHRVVSVSIGRFPDHPKGKAVKYETPAGFHMVLDVHPINKDPLRCASIPDWCTEGVKNGLCPHPPQRRVGASGRHESFS